MNLAADNTSIALASGRRCVLHKIKTELIPNYDVLAFAKHQGQPCVDDVADGWRRDVSLRSKNGY